MKYCSKVTAAIMALFASAYVKRGHCVFSCTHLNLDCRRHWNVLSEVDTPSFQCGKISSRFSIVGNVEGHRVAYSGIPSRMAWIESAAEKIVGGRVSLELREDAVYFRPCYNLRIIRPQKITYTKLR